MTELEQLRQGWKATIHGDGGKCPCCDRFGKVYARGINETMAKSLQWLYNQNMQKGLREWIDVPNSADKAVLRTNQLSTLRWWGLVERMTPPPDEKKNKTKHSGMWRITLKGLDFVEGRTFVARQVFTYAGEVVGQTDDEQVNFDACKGKKFDIDSTMQQTYHKGADALHGALSGGIPVNRLAVISSATPFEHRGNFKNAPV